mmetsp:Transcript_10170/g.36172  ORF Transcript_10170/g.36172 Transcript_10170/m.36172 type:complete len:346 (-) Transcript_10170:330-1367(-)
MAVAEGSPRVRRRVVPHPPVHHPLVRVVVVHTLGRKVGGGGRGGSLLAPRGCRRHPLSLVGLDVLGPCRAPLLSRRPLAALRLTSLCRARPRLLPQRPSHGRTGRIVGPRPVVHPPGRQLLVHRHAVALGRPVKVVVRVFSRVGRHSVPTTVPHHASRMVRSLMAPVTSHWRVPVRSGPRGRREHPLGRLRALGVSPALVVGVRVGVVGALGSNAEIVSSGRGVVAHWGRAPPLDDGRGEVLGVGNRRQHVPGRRGHGARVVKVREGVLEKPRRILGRVIRGGRPQVEEVPVDVRLLGAGAGGRRGDRLGLLRGGSPLAVLRHFSLCVCFFRLALSRFSPNAPLA